MAATRARACTGKDRLTKAGAEARVAGLIKAGQAEGSVVAYRCPFDRGRHWHVGHPPSRKRRSR